ncbi:MAG: ATP-binding cassette domain-containing protein, partial [Anaerolineales bacterium]|nr:ATP-binding cassette domain-containing protein [Anaerolineales bacterium]
MSELAIDVQGLKRVYQSVGQDVTALRDLDLQVGVGRFVAVKGRSGSGKTTLLNCLGGLDQPTAGSIKIHGREITGLSEQQLTEWRQREVGFIFQSFGLFPTLSAYENVELMLRIGRIPRRERKQRALECLALVGLSKWV